MKDSAPTKRWVKVYEKFGAEGVMRKNHKETYSTYFKLDVLRYMDRTGSSEMNTALHCGITNHSTIGPWKKAYLEGGAEALDKPKGRPPMSDKAKTKKRVRQGEAGDGSSASSNTFVDELEEMTLFIRGTSFAGYLIIATFHLPMLEAVLNNRLVSTLNLVSLFGKVLI